MRRLHLPLLVLGRVVVAVLGEVAELAGRLDLAGDVDPARAWSGRRARPSAARRRPGTAACLGHRQCERSCRAPALTATTLVATLACHCIARRRNHHHVAHAAARRALLDRPPRWAVFSFLRTAREIEHRDPPDRQSSAATASAPRSSPRPSRSCAPPASTSTPSTTTSAARRYLRDGEVLPDAVLDELRGFDAILLGAVGTPDVPPGVLERGLLLRLRFELDLYVNLRPFAAPPRRRLRRHPREHRGHLRRRGRVPAQGHAPRGRHPGLGQHPHGRRALRPLRLRPGREPRPAGTSRWCTRPTCSPSPATSGSARSTRWPPSTPTSTTAYNHVDAACIYFVQDPSATT